MMGYSDPHHVIKKETGKALDHTTGLTFHEAIEKYRKYYKNSRLCLMYEEGLDVVEIKETE